MSLCQMDNSSISLVILLTTGKINYIYYNGIHKWVSGPVWVYALQGKKVQQTNEGMI